MKKIKSNLKKGELTLKVESTEDLWHLSGIIDPGDMISGRTVRKIKIGGSENRKADIIKKQVFVTIVVEKVSFSRSIKELRVSGKVYEGTDDIPSGVYHTFCIKENSVITIKKESWLKYQLEKVEDSCKDQLPKIVLAAFDREEAYFALLEREGIKQLSSIKGKVSKKGIDVQGDGKFYSEIAKQIREYLTRYTADKAIVATPSFWKEYFMQSLNDEDLKKKIVLSSCSAVGKNSFSEILKREEIKSALKQDRITKEVNNVESVLSEISKDGLVAYGIDKVKGAAESGAVTKLLVTDKFIMESREDGLYESVEHIMKDTETSQGEIMIISSQHEGGKKLDGIGGIAALLRYKVE